MDLKNIDLKTMPAGVKVGLIAALFVIIAVLVAVFLILPKYKEIQRLRGEITQQENEIAKDQAKSAKLSTLKLENEKLKRRLEELKLQLPEEREVSGLLKQVSDLGIKSGLKIVSWKPEQKRDHLSGIIYEIPVSVELSGTYHNLGIFFSSLTKLSRIVNIADIKISDPKSQVNEATDKITFKATTFSAIPESEISAKAPESKKK
ncbi:MAG TPA: type 4a pilus biogenesis protein PilO [Thermodesulfovibrionales bacterium]|jgi:type IV pilus assembly protein PilO|nr:type 4a pilus biogenesis protein PilO [Thermodesulfovibrionales bacterium]